MFNSIKNTKLIFLFMALIMVMSFFVPSDLVYADGNKSNVKHGEIFGVTISDDGGVEIGEGFGSEETKGWQGIIEKYKYFIGGFGALALVTVVGALIIQFTKLSAAGDNPMKRKEILTGIGWTFVATVLLGATATIVAIAYRFL